MSTVRLQQRDVQIRDSEVEARMCRSSWTSGSVKKPRERIHHHESGRPVPRSEIARILAKKTSMTSMRAIIERVAESSNELEVVEHWMRRRHDHGELDQLDVCLPAISGERLPETPHPP